MILSDNIVALYREIAETGVWWVVGLVVDSNDHSRLLDRDYRVDWRPGHVDRSRAAIEQLPPPYKTLIYDCL